VANWRRIVDTARGAQLFGLFKKPPSGPPKRLGYEDSCRRLQPRHLDAGAIPPLPDRMPAWDDELPGVSFFRTRLDGSDDLSDLTLPRTFFGRSEIQGTSFRNANLAQSRLCWNDFTEADFTGASLAGSDLRASQFIRVRFSGADLSDADLRQSHFDRCVFTDTRLAGAILTPEQGRQMVLSRHQRDEIAWTQDDGPEPGGG
jgi:hypothetical protein